MFEEFFEKVETCGAPHPGRAASSQPGKFTANRELLWPSVADHCRFVTGYPLSPLPLKVCPNLIWRAKIVVHVIIEILRVRGSRKWKLKLWCELARTGQGR